MTMTRRVALYRTENVPNLIDSGCCKSKVLAKVIEPTTQKLEMTHKTFYIADLILTKF